MNFRLSAAAAAAGGLLYASPFFPHGAEWVSQIAAFIGLAGLLFSIREETSWKKASLLGFIFGLLAFTPGLSWLYQSLHDFGGLPAPLSGAALLLMGAANSIFTALAAAAVSRVRPGPLRAAAAFPASFVFFDWIRGAALCSFPWISFGYIQTGTPFEGFAPVGGVYASELAATLHPWSYLRGRASAGEREAAVRLYRGCGRASDFGAGAPCGQLDRSRRAAVRPSRTAGSAARRTVRR